MFQTDWVRWQWVDLAISALSIVVAILLCAALHTVGVEWAVIQRIIYMVRGNTRFISSARVEHDIS